MFILYGVVLGLGLGLILGGRAEGLARLEFRWGWVFAAGLGVQVVLFSEPVTARIGELGVPIYVVSTAVVAMAVIANRRITGMPLVALGALSNMAAIVANGGYMPASAEAMAVLGKTAPTVYSNSTFVQDPALAPLTDIFALPPWLPWANVFSPGDVLIAAGVILIIVSAMRRRPAILAVRSDNSPEQPSEPVPMGHGRPPSGLLGWPHETTSVSSLRDRPGQTRREAGTQSQGSPSGDRPAAEIGASVSHSGKENP